MNSIFPASYSTLQSSALADLVSRKYGLAAVRCEFLVRGVGDTYLVESAGERVVRKAPEVRSLANGHASVAAQAPIELTVSDVDCQIGRASCRERV